MAGGSCGLRILAVCSRGAVLLIHSKVLWEIAGGVQHTAVLLGRENMLFHHSLSVLWKPCQHPTNGNHCCTSTIPVRLLFVSALLLCSLVDFFFPVHTTQSLLVSPSCSFLFQGREGAGEPDLIIPASRTVPLSPL